jgi:hypothetical protein
MNARILVATTLVVSALSPHAQAQPDLVAKNGRVTIEIVLTPSDYLKPVSRTYLLPQYAESIPGNSVQMFLRCFMERSNMFGQAESELREKWNAAPLKDLPAGQLRNYQDALRQDMYDAARMTNVDWQLWYFLKRDGYSVLLPDAQKMRALASAMKPRVRGEIAAGDSEAAIHTLKTLFGLARTFKSHPTLIGFLIGLAITTEALGAVEELIQLPGSPNLYWALMDLPQPFLTLRLGIEGERLMIGAAFESLKTSPSAVADSVVLKQIEALDAFLRLDSKEKGKPESEQVNFKVSVQTRGTSADEVKGARARLVELGLNADHVKSWSALHVVLMDEVMQCEYYRDELSKFINLPYWQAKPGMDGVLVEIGQRIKKWPSLAFVLPLANVQRSQARLTQRIAYLQIIEAIRLHAQKNGGSLPEKLADIKLPLPVDPATGKSFEYSVRGGVATLHGENLYPGTELLNRYYEIRLSK